MKALNIFKVARRHITVSQKISERYCTKWLIGRNPGVQGIMTWTIQYEMCSELGNSQTMSP